MTEAATPQIGTDHAATLFAQGMRVESKADKVLAVIPDLATRLAEMQADAGKESSVILELLSAVNSVVDQQNKQTVILSRIADGAVRTATAIEKLEARTDALGGECNLIDARLNDLDVWLRNVLIAFEGGVILARLDEVKGMTEALTDKHNDIHELVNSGVEQVKPLMVKLEKSPILRMLGVPNNG